MSNENKQTGNVPFSPWPHYDEDEIQAVGDVLRSGKVNYWTGEEARQFEREYAAYTGRRHAIALMNGTVALELALYAFGIGPGDEVITTTRTFIASASAAVMRGATPVIADVDPVSQNVTLDTIKRVVTDRTKAIIPVHLAGWPCEMDEIMAFANERGIKVIEDCAQAHGASYRGKPVGSFGHAAAFSFCQDKIMTTGGEGGMLVMDDEHAWEVAWAFKDHGKSFYAVYNRPQPPGYRWLHESFGTNFRMTELQAVLGRMQLRKLPEWIAARRRNAAILNEGFAGVPGIRLTMPPPHIEHAYYKYYVFIKPESIREDWGRDRIMQAINEAGVPCLSGSCSEIYLEKAFEGTASRPVGRLPVAKELGENSLMFLVHPTLNEENMHRTVEVVRDVMRVATTRQSSE
ncbi:MAG: DegT/DnrJ/EryC1/StrS aminotransferase family protein [Gallionella sp.]|nr:DegT/DnrJ/EryC1/StrS aminotransferase family protein [Gallionella sp.]MDD4945437.1 DegT/DnrJ/EryC1/StrS aminotransferase family protein [Gallionella sp.]MDD5611448.1 DegT/DnrJ/EryC1/StrS aminotransferase family protein [Gallionella sp.]